jgi:hypothetical protein
MKNVKSDFLLVCCSVIAISLALLGPLTTQTSRAQRRDHAAGTVYEGETFLTSGKVTVSGGNLMVQPMSAFGQGWSGDAQLFWGGGQSGAVLDLTLDVPTRAMYEVELHMTRAPDYGRLKIQVDGKNAAQFDGYAPAVAPSGPISVGTFDLGPGPGKLSFMIWDKNTKATGFLVGIDYIRLIKSTLLPPKATGEKWEILWLTVKPDPTHLNEFKQPSYMDGEKLTVSCAPNNPSHYQYKEGEAAATVIISDNGVVKDATGVSGYGSGPDYDQPKTISYYVNGPGKHVIKCAVAVIGKSNENSITAEMNVSVSVMGNKPTEAKWATAPIIVKPAQNQKVTGGNIVVQPYDPLLSHCADGGSFSLDWQYLNQSTSTWQSINKLSSLWKCVPGGSTKDISAMKPGLYKVRAKETNGKYNFESDWSAWVTFELVAAK